MTDVAPVSSFELPSIRRVDLDQPWQWLGAGWRDMRRAPGASVAYGVLFAAAGYLLTWLIWWAEAFALILPLMAGFLLIGPILAVGLYDVSRRLERGESVGFAESLKAWRSNMSQIALMGVALMLFLLLWLRIATVVFAIFFADNPPRPELLFLIDVFVSERSLPFLVVGTLIGGVLAALVFAISAISIPLLLDRDANVITAMVASFEAVRRNFWTMAFWACLIALFVGVGLVTAYIGLIVTLPLIGHASWHAYKALVVWDKG